MSEQPRPAGPSGPPAAPFITRRSLLYFSAVAAMAFVAYGQLYQSSNSGAGRLGMAAAGAFGIALVVGVVAWIGGMRLAARSGSMLWLFIVALMPPFGSLAYSLWGPTGPVTPPGVRRPPGMRR